MSEIPQCCVCYNENCMLVMLSCHYKHVVCIECLNKVNKCPLCRVEVQHPKVLNNKLFEEYEFVRKQVDELKNFYEFKDRELNQKLNEKQSELDVLSADLQKIKIILTPGTKQTNGLLKLF